MLSTTVLSAGSPINDRNKPRGPCLSSLLEMILMARSLVEVMGATVQIELASSRLVQIPL